jgi:hypothetical protein
MIHLLDKFFIVFHTSLIILNLFGWIWKPTRILNLSLLLITLFSWTILGIWFGFGYCPLTEWHWKILEKSGAKNLPDSYIKYLIDRITGLDLDPGLIEAATIIFFSAAFICSITINLKDYTKRKNKP